MVEEGLLASNRYRSGERMDHFHTNFPDSPIDSQKKFRLNLAESLVQTLLDLMASPTCPPYLQTAKGRRPVSASKRLIGKHFAYKNKKRGRCVW